MVSAPLLPKCTFTQNVFQGRSWGMVTLWLCHLNLIKLFIMINQVAAGVFFLIITVQSLIIAGRIQECSKQF